MSTRFQFASHGCLVSSRRERRTLGILLGLILMSPITARAQGAPLDTIGQVDGRDVSIEGGAAARPGMDDPGRENYVSNGSIVTVHSGSARMKLFAGGEVSICGPAKFTVLLSEDSITVAVDFGRVRVRLPVKTALRVFTPTIIGTPLDISGGARDVTLGLNLDDSLCVRATSGAVQLEHQFTGEKLIVPQAGEFFLSAGKLMPVAGSPGGCACDPDEPQTTPARSAPGTDSATAIPMTPPAMPPQPGAATQTRAAVSAPAPESTLEYSVLAQGNDARPVVVPPKKTTPSAPPVTLPVYTVVLPPLVFQAGSPSPPPDPPGEMILLIREARVSPEWEFAGHVAAPEFAQAVQSALGEGGPAQPSPPATGAGTSQTEEKTPKKKGGFWASFRKAFGG
jgi:hypothetical protein